MAISHVAIGQRLPTPEVLTVEDGLCFRNVNNIAQDHQGLLWFGTEDGLSRFDGYRFLNFGNDPNADLSFPYNKFVKNSLLFRNDSIFWSIVNDQLYEMNTNSFQSKRVLGIEGKIYKLVLGKNKDVWLVSSTAKNQILWHFNDKDGFRKISTAAHFRYELTDLGVDTSGHLWWSTMLEGLQEFNPVGEKLKEIKLDSFIWHGYKLFLSEFLIDSQNRIFFYSRNTHNNHSVWQYFPQSGAKKLIVDGFKTHHFEAYIDSEDNLWVAKEEGILQVDPNGNVTDHTKRLRQVLDFTTINSIYEDSTNVLWLGTDGGLIKMPVYKKRFENYFSKKGFGWGNAMRAIGEDQNGSLFFFCETGAKGLYRMDPEINQIESLALGMENEDIFFNKLGLSNNFIFDTVRNCVWTLNLKLWKIDLESQKLESPSDLFFERDHNSFFPIIFLADRKILVGHTLEKLAIFDPETGQSKNLIDEPIDQNSDAIVKVFLEQSQDSIWVGTLSDGLFLFDREGRKLAHYNSSTAPALSSNDIISLHYDKVHRKIYAGTFGGGLNCLDLVNGEIRNFHQKHGLPDNNIVSILSDQENLWLGTYNGLSCFNIKQETFRNYFEEDGLTDNEFNYSSAFKSRDGKLYFGGMNGINSFYPQELLNDAVAPTLHLTRFTKQEEDSDKSFHFEANTDLQDPFVISPDISYFQFEWTMPSYLSQKKIRYFTWLEGLEEGWTPLGKTPNLRFNKLPPGDYVLHLKGKDGKGNWSKQPLQLSIKVLPPWWNTWWSYGLFFLLLSGIVIFFWKKETRELQLQNQLEREFLEAERLRELDQAKTRFFTNISHEFRTPLTIISGMAQQIEEQPKEWFKEGLTMIKRNTQRLGVLVNQMLDLTKLESGKMQLNLQQHDMIHILKYMVESIHSLAESKKIKVHFLSEEEVVKMDFDQEKIHQIMVNLLSNAVKFTPSGGDIYVWVRIISNSKDSTLPPQQVLQIKVKDTGVGIPEAQLPFIFDRFYQVDDSQTRYGDGTGIGLALVKELVKLMKGEIFVKSKLGQETVFTLTLPIHNKASELALAINPKNAKSVTFDLDLSDELFINNLENKNGSSVNLNGARQKILLIEDHPDVVAYVAACLKNEYEIQVGKDGEEGIQIALAEIPDLIITDVMMPYKDGFEVCQTLKKDERTSHVPIIMLTARADMDSKLEGLTMGADAYLAKPFHKKELCIRIKKLLELRKNLQKHYLVSLGISIPAASPIPDLLPPSIIDPFGQKVKTIVEAHLDDFDFSVEKLCKEICMSHSQLHRKLSALTGLSPNKFIRNVRLNKAKSLLQAAETTITSAALSTGFNDPSYFGRVFKKEFGMTPMEWKEQVK